jgi:hypothetical protein
MSNSPLVLGGSAPERRNIDLGQVGNLLAALSDASSCRKAP